MEPDQISRTLGTLLERLAALEHERWAHWQAYMNGKCEPRPDGALVIPPDLVRQWQRQIDTPYAALSEEEKESDREQVRRYLPLIEAALTNCQEPPAVPDENSRPRD